MIEEIESPFDDLSLKEMIRNYLYLKIKRPQRMCYWCGYSAKSERISELRQLFYTPKDNKFVNLIEKNKKLRGT